MNLHRIKIEERYFDAIRRGSKTSELRINDRDYQAGDVLRFMTKWSGDRPAEATFEGDYILRDGGYKITHVLQEVEGLASGYCILSIKEILQPTKSKNERSKK